MKKDNCLKTENEKKLSLVKNGSSLGAGIGAKNRSFFSNWLLGGAVYWGMPVLIYFVAIIVIIAIFLPLFKIIEMLG